ncbi:MAG: rhodanese-like domain-containing protein [Saprospiraceae bacterium]|nr:rhodanese-like domain-containing protein [Saprospiraceae bacterium]
MQIIDVRNKEEYEQGHIPNALNISLQELKNNRVTQGNLTPRSHGTVRESLLHTALHVCKSHKDNIP